RGSRSSTRLGASRRASRRALAGISILCWYAAHSTFTKSPGHDLPAKIGRLDGRSGRVRTTIIGRTERVGSTLNIGGISHPMALPFPFPFSKLRIRGTSHPIALPLQFPLPFPILRIISVAFPLPFQYLLPLSFPILRITGVL